MAIRRVGFRPSRLRSSKLRHGIRLTTGLGLLLLLPGCGFFAPSEAQTSRPGRSDDNQPVAVETARAQRGSLTAALVYTGTTRPQQQIALRAQTAGEVVAVNVDVGDSVQTGDTLARIDGSLLSARVNEAQAELSVRRSEIAESQVSIADAEAVVAQARATRDQAKIDADRLRQLANQGAIAQQAAEAAELALVNAEQALNSSQAQLQARQQTITAAAGRVEAQQAVVAEAQEQLRWVALAAPQAATVLNRLVDPGDYVQPGATLLELGDLSVLNVAVQVSELDFGRLSVGQPAQIRLDAFGEVGAIAGRITRISPVADAVSRLVTVEVTMNNPDRRIGSGLLARVSFTPTKAQQIVVPTSALATGNADDTIFVVEPDIEPPKVTARSVTIGQTKKGQIEILSGLSVNESFVVQSDRPLKTGQAVRLSILSEAENP
ncbi:MAG: efflux RND transporter periplasmic adaptor subunit [Cyanobacteria bacterium P01_B01_bin.77]